MILRNILRRWKICIALFSLLSFFTTGTGLQACYWRPENEELRYMLFNPDLLQNRAWWSFFYSAHLHAFDGRYSSSRDEDQLIAEWITAAGASPGDTTAARACVFGEPSDSALAVNNFYQKLQQKPAVFACFKTLKQYEGLAGFESTWSDTGRKSSSGAYDSALEQVSALVAREQNTFLQKKYAFLLTKIAFYAPDRALFNATYNRYFKNVATPGVLDWWAMHYKAMMLEGIHNDSANYLHARVFSHATAKMMVSRQFYSSRDMDSVLALAEDNRSRADVYVLRETINPGRGLEGIRQVYTLAADHPHLPLLIGREVNKFEDWLGTTRYVNAQVSPRDYWGNRPVTENWQRDRLYLDEFVKALKTMDGLARRYPAYLNVVLANLSLMQGNGKAAAAYLDRVPTGDPAMAYQVTALRAVQITLQEDVRDRAVQEKLGVLYKTLLADRNGQFESQKILYSLSTYLRHVFAKRGVVGLAGLFDSYARERFCYSCITYGTFEYTFIRYLDRYASTADLEALLEVYRRKDKNTLEEVLFKPYDHPHYFEDLLVTKYLRQGDVANALATVRKIPDAFWSTFSNAQYYLDRDPFTVNAELLAGQTMVTYTKREIVEKLYALDTAARQDPAQRAHNYFMLGNAWFTFTTHAWFMLSYGDGSATPDEAVYAIGYTNARRYFKKALDAERDPEKRVRALYMLALLSESKKEKLVYARQYEEYETTAFYGRRNCLTLYDLAEKN
ncbi:hypothetical protein [Dawidia soli]|uniref:Uncharacterized protein n=1 Tax=Dawidia soli TaxID=2782352 RepID=A0AAP2D8E6_9BACT|nr:hypothetical protein [Dawidia soli]MBT1686260.1 hypothetical protein [Dawidia soli]